MKLFDAKAIEVFDNMKILNVQRMSTEDGPGLRTTVFFKGCPLHCLWCHNPESIEFNNQKEWIRVRCIGCQECIKWCPNQAISYIDGEIVTDIYRCTVCGKCIEKCPGEAMQAIGKTTDPKILAKELLKDKSYFGNTGGVTLSGGEVMSQVDEAVVLCKYLKEEGIHIAIDTSGFVPFSAFEKILPYIDLILYDLKINDSDLHLKYCSVNNSLIKENLIKLNKQNVKIWIRTPIIPNSTDSVDNITGIANFIQTNDIKFERWELCAFNNLATDKYERLHETWAYSNTPLIEKEVMERLTTVAKTIIGSNMEILYTGMTALKENNHEYETR